MPYIEQERRIVILNDPDVHIENTGELNYILTKIVIGYMEYHGKSYDTLSQITAALDDVKDEFRRRVVHPYEDSKKQENGDVYE